MVEIQSEILDELMCSYCGFYLSCGPIRMKQDGTTICGRCLAPDDSVIIHPYEKVVSNIIFPCRFKKYGCKITDLFNTIKNHEDFCEFTEFTCPIITDGTCAWKGATIMMKTHAESHDRFLKHPCKMSYDFNQTNTVTYLTVLENHVFTIHVKICSVSRKMFHCVRLFNDSDCAHYFEFCLKMKSNSGKFSKKHKAVPYTSFEEENKSLITSITALQELFNDLKGNEFILTINKLFDIIRCVDCKQLVEKYVYQSYDEYKCEKCAPKEIQCSDCLIYKDIESKMEKHKYYFCEKSDKSKNFYEFYDECCIYEDVPSLYQHIIAKHPEFISNSWNSEFSINFKKGTILICRLITDGNIDAYCQFMLMDDEVDVRIYTLVPQKKLVYDCRIEIRYEKTNHYFSALLNKTDDSPIDWYIELNRQNLPNKSTVRLTLVPKKFINQPPLEPTA